jgi:hypothetical protein
MKELIKEGFSLEYKGISIARLDRRYRPYQVHSDNSKCKFSELYDDLDEAIDKFNALRLIVKDK